VLHVDEETVAAHFPIESRRLRIAVGETSEALDADGCRLRAVTRTGDPDIITVSLAGEAAARILGDFQIAGGTERAVVGIEKSEVVLRPTFT